MSTQDEGLTYHGELPCTLAPLVEPLSAAALQRLDEANELLLKALLGMDEKHDLDESDAVAQELKRQDLKLNLILDLLSTLLQQQQLRPAPVELRFSTDNLSLREDVSLAPESPCLVSLYLDPRLPRPLQLAGVASEPPAPGWTRVHLKGLGQAVADNLDKFIFRHHRRQVAAQQKRSN
ncbi:MAG TPA: PilZ domain-containing protein [Hyphomicrobiales bacterium]|nr:PilZ domain-containing protein [Hyphomicrobiales bacterium]